MNGIVTQKMGGKFRFMDVRKDEQMIVIMMMITSVTTLRHSKNDGELLWPILHGGGV